jgi:hypothetical protein
MTSKTDLEKQAYNLREIFEARFAELQAQIAALRGEKAWRWKPENNETIYVIHPDGNIDEDSWLDSHKPHLDYYQAFNVFPTREAAEKEARMAKTMRHLRVLNGG